MKFLWEKDMVESSNMAVLQCTAARGWRFNVSDVLVGNIDTENLNRRNAVKIREGCWWVDGTAASCLKTIIISAHVALAEIAPLSFVGPFYLTSIIYATIQNLLCHSVAPCPHIIRTKFHPTQT